MIVLPSFQLTTRLNLQKKLIFFREHWHIILYMNIGNSNWLN